MKNEGTDHDMLDALVEDRITNPPASEPVDDELVEAMGLDAPVLDWLLTNIGAISDVAREIGPASDAELFIERALYAMPRELAVEAPGVTLDDPERVDDMVTEMGQSIAIRFGSFREQFTEAPAGLVQPGLDWLGKALDELWAYRSYQDNADLNELMVATVTSGREIGAFPDDGSLPDGVVDFLLDRANNNDNANRD